MRFREKTHNVDFCVVGGGMAGICAAIAAARNGARVAIMQDRPMFGGNASSEIRMWICGAYGEQNRETGILEEIALENLYRNPYKIYGIWDSILYEKVKYEPNIDVILNCSCQDVVMEDNIIKSVKGWQLTTQTYHIVEAKMFADCSGDSILAPLTGAFYRMGKEAHCEYNEDLAPEKENSNTMGNTCLIQARETNSKREFICPKWAYKFTPEMLGDSRKPDLSDPGENYWYMELGGMQDTIHDAEEIRDELLKVAFGMWDYIKTHEECNAQNWELEWVGFLPGKRESRRYIGDHVLNQNEVRAGGKFPDVVAFGGWTMDDHPSEGLYFKGKPTVFHDTPSPYGIPYRCLYSKNIYNLFFAGRNISVTHMAMSSTRVMATCAVLGQAVGTAAAIAVKNNLSPRGVYEQKIEQLQQNIMNDDGFIPYKTKNVSSITKSAILHGTGKNLQSLTNGIERLTDTNINAWKGKIGDYIEYSFEDIVYIKDMRFVFDSDLARSTIDGNWFEKQLLTHCNVRLNQGAITTPKTIVKDFDIMTKDANGNWEVSLSIIGNYQRLVRLPLNKKVKAIKFIPKTTHGSEEVSLFSWELN